MTQPNILFEFYDYLILSFHFNLHRPLLDSRLYISVYITLGMSISDSFDTC